MADPWRDAKYDSARVKIAVAAFLPSQVWEDTAVWSATTSSRRTLLIGGRFANGRYRLEATRTLSPVVQIGDSRHTINLTRLSADEYAWDTDVGYAVGGITASEAGHLIGAALASAEGRTERDVRADYGAAAPRAVIAIGQLYRVDSIRTVTLPDRSTIATFAATMTPQGIEAKYPSFAKYMRQYGEGAAMHWIVTDRAGIPYLDFTMTNGRIALRTRTLASALLPLPATVAARPMPDSLLLTGSITLRVRHFTVGFRDYRADLTVIRTPHERALSLASRREPAWILPLVAERLLRTPLRRPFQGSGALFRVGVRDDSTGGQSVLLRRMHLEVQESLILRFFSRLGAMAIGDYSGNAEREQYAWLSEVFGALASDARDLKAVGPAGPVGPPGASGVITPPPLSPSPTP